MVAPTSAPLHDAPDAPPEPRVGTYDNPPCPLTPELRSDIAYRRAFGSPWVAIAGMFHYDEDAIRRATENDPDYPAALERAWDEVTREGQSDGMRRLRLIANSFDDTDRALKAAEILMKYAREERRDHTRLSIEKLRSETKLAVEAARIEGRVAKEAEESPWLTMPIPKPETHEEMAIRREVEAAAAAAEMSKKELPDVYIWGGKHPLGRSVGPDETDTRVRLKPDWSWGLGSRGTVYWVVPDPVPLLAAMPGEPDGGAAVAAWNALKTDAPEG